MWPLSIDIKPLGLLIALSLFFCKTKYFRNITESEYKNVQVYNVFFIHTQVIPPTFYTMAVLSSECEWCRHGIGYQMQVLLLIVVPHTYSGNVQCSINLKMH